MSKIIFAFVLFFCFNIKAQTKTSTLQERAYLESILEKISSNDPRRPLLEKQLLAIKTATQANDSNIQTNNNISSLNSEEESDAALNKIIEANTTNTSSTDVTSQKKSRVVYNSMLNAQQQVPPVAKTNKVAPVKAMPVSNIQDNVTQQTVYNSMLNAQQQAPPVAKTNKVAPVKVIPASNIQDNVTQQTVYNSMQTNQNTSSIDEKQMDSDNAVSPNKVYNTTIDNESIKNKTKEKITFTKKDIYLDADDNRPTNNTSINSSSIKKSSNGLVPVNVVSTGSYQGQKMAVRRTAVSNNYQINSNDKEFEALLAESKKNRTETTVDMLNTLFDQDINSSDAIILIKNNFNCNLILNINGANNYKLAVPALGENTIVIPKGSYQLSGKLCGKSYLANKKVQKNLVVSLKPRN